MFDLVPLPLALDVSISISKSGPGHNLTTIDHYNVLLRLYVLCVTTEVPQTSNRARA